jgi:hypothetical protein
MPEENNRSPSELSLGWFVVLPVCDHAICGSAKPNVAQTRKVATRLAQDVRIEGVRR